MTPEPSEPPRYVAYPRKTQVLYGSAVQLKAVGEAYFAYNYAYLKIIGIFVGAFALGAFTFQFLFLTIPLACYLAGRISHPLNVTVLSAKGYPKWVAVTASVAMGLTSVFCFGLFGLVILQQIALNEMRKYGFKVGFTFGKRKFYRFVSERQQAEIEALESYNIPRSE